MSVIDRSYAAGERLLRPGAATSRIALAAAACVIAPAAALVAAPAAAPTYTHDVAPILAAHCGSCHDGVGIAADLPLITYEDVRKHARAIRAAVATRRMPPWPADSRHSLPFRNDPELFPVDIDTIVRWVDAGAARGDAPESLGAPRSGAREPAAPQPAAPGVVGEWHHPAGTPPDAVLTLPEVTLAASGEVPYVLQRIKVPLLHDRWIAAMEVRPGNASVVHHMGITEIALPPGVSAAELDNFARMARQMGIGDGAADAVRPAVPDPINPQAYDMLGVYTPGTTFEMFGDGSGKLLKGGNDLYINFNVHYTTVGKVVTDRSQLALWFSAKPAAHQLFRAPSAVSTLIANGRELLTDDPGTKAEGTQFAIPPVPRFADNYQLVGLTAYVEPVTLYQLQPHAHMRGKDFSYSVVYPDGHELTILSVPHYDFHWQLAYQLATPLALPAGAKLVVTAHYDNSTRNPHLRNLGNSILGRHCGPDKVAYFRRQNQSWHEMFSPLVQYSIDADSQVAPLPLVEVVGCLARAPSGLTLTRAGAPQAATTQSTSSVEAREASGRALGEQSYALIGGAPFAPDSYLGAKVVLKGVLLTQPNRINVTSLQAAGGSCP